MAIPNDHSIKMFIHCAKCLKELPEGTSPRDYVKVEVGWTVQGLQVWCIRHEANVLHVDFEGQQHPANLSCKAVKQEGG